MTATASLRHYDSLPDRIRHHRQADARGVLLVEGVTDQRFIDRLFGGNWAVFSAGSRAAVVTSIERCLTIEVQKIVGLIDRDFDDLADDACSRLPIFAFAEADLEAFLVGLPSFLTVIEELGSAEKIGRHGGAEDLRRRAIDIACEAGRLRFANAVSGWGLPFDEVQLDKKVKASTMEFNRTSYVSALVSACRNEVSVNTIEEGLKGAPEPESVLYRGRDAIAAVLSPLRQMVGKVRFDDPEQLAKVVRLSAQVREVERSHPFAAIAAALE